MQCQAINCDQTATDDYLCLEHSKVVMDFHRSFGGDELAYQVLNVEQIRCQNTIIEPNWVNTSREVVDLWSKK